MARFLVELILIVFLLFVFALSWRPNQIPEAGNSEVILSEVGDNLRKIAQRAKVQLKDFTLQASNNKTFVKNKKDIHLVVRDKNKKLYDKNTINRAAIHEMAHILCPTNEHCQIFNSIENNLLKHASALGIYDSKKKLDTSYPCLDSDLG